jgi:hypothetical protein
MKTNKKPSVSHAWMPKYVATATTPRAYTTTQPENNNTTRRFT